MVCFACWTGLKHALGSVWRCFRLGSTCLPQLQAWQRLKAKVSYEETLKSVKDFNSKNRGLAKRMTRPCSRLVRCNIEPRKEDMHEPPFESHFTWRTSLYTCWIVLSLFSCLWGYRKKGIYCPLDLTWFDWIAAVTSPVLSQTIRKFLSFCQRWQNCLGEVWGLVINWSHMPSRKSALWGHRWSKYFFRNI